MKMNIKIPAITAIIILFGAVYLHFLFNPIAPSCSDSSITALVKETLSTKLNVEGDISLSNIISISGGAFSHSRRCEADVSGVTNPTAVFTVRNDHVYYSVQHTDDGKSIYVKSQLIPFPQ
ncbi:hypothetical protein [Acetobacter fabarum]|uniref:hypothetical protein n=1 Tax=Acetobacter fabarum TaxID=483199 RepID=UPI0039EABA36